MFPDIHLFVVPIYVTRGVLVVIYSRCVSLQYTKTNVATVAFNQLCGAANYDTISNALYNVIKRTFLFVYNEKHILNTSILSAFS